MKVKNKTGICRNIQFARLFWNQPLRYSGCVRRSYSPKEKILSETFINARKVRIRMMQHFLDTNKSALLSPKIIVLCVRLREGSDRIIFFRIENIKRREYKNMLAILPFRAPLIARRFHFSQK